MRTQRSLNFMSAAVIAAAIAAPLMGAPVSADPAVKLKTLFGRSLEVDPAVTPATLLPDLQWAFQQSLEAVGTYQPSAQHILKPLPVDKTTGEVSVATITNNVTTQDGKLVPTFVVDGKVTDYIWVSGGTELKDKIAPWKGTQAGLKIRLREILGLRPETPDDYVVTLTVKGADVFRPTPNPITSTEWPDPSGKLPPNEYPTIPADAPAWYPAWFAGNALFSYRPAGYPWTHIGYTYDWKPGLSDHYGVSEYIIEPGAVAVTWSVAKIADYFGGAAE